MLKLRMNARRLYEEVLVLTALHGMNVEYGSSTKK